MEQLRISVCPILGEVDKETRLGSLRGCHAILERTVRRNVDHRTFDRELAAAVKELLLADRASALLGQKSLFLVELKTLE